jgi:hypothetical protein
MGGCTLGVSGDGALVEAQRYVNVAVAILHPRRAQQRFEMVGIQRQRLLVLLAGLRDVSIAMAHLRHSYV